MGSFSKMSVRRFRSVIREYAKAEQAAPAVNKAKKTVVEETTASARMNGGDISKAFWMQDPNTGNWMPENHFEDLDAADLRKKLLSKTTRI